MNFISKTIKAFASLSRVLQQIRRAALSRTMGIAEAPDAVIAPETPLQNPVSAPTHVGPMPVPSSDEHQLSPEAQVERYCFIQRLMNPEQGTEATEKLTAGSSMTKAIQTLRKAFPPLVVKPDTSMAEIQHAAGQQAVLAAMERMHQRGAI
ncbi:hypothetical protein [Aeromonas sanarellii]|uniref:hypothetical protein n=1 Tax=Aeromonas sanarellii TaxID=633415 RepID=UPI003BA063E7